MVKEQNCGRGLSNWNPGTLPPSAHFHRPHPEAGSSPFQNTAHWLGPSEISQVQSILKQKAKNKKQTRPQTLTTKCHTTLSYHTSLETTIYKPGITKELLKRCTEDWRKKRLWEYSSFQKAPFTRAGQWYFNRQQACSSDLICWPEAGFSPKGRCQSHYYCRQQPITPASPEEIAIKSGLRGHRSWTKSQCHILDIPQNNPGKC